APHLFSPSSGLVRASPAASIILLTVCVTPLAPPPSASMRSSSARMSSGFFPIPSPPNEGQNRQGPCSDFEGETIGNFDLRCEPVLSPRDQRTRPALLRCRSRKTRKLKLSNECTSTCHRS